MTVCSRGQSYTSYTLGGVATKTRKTKRLFEKYGIQVIVFVVVLVVVSVVVFLVVFLLVVMVILVVIFT